MSVDHPLSRRQFTAIGLGGVGLALSAASPADKRVPITPASAPDAPEMLALLARLHGDLRGHPAYAWFDGTMLAVAPGGATELLGGFRGVVARRVRRLGGEAGWEVHQRELSTAYSLEPETDEAGFINPVTGRIIIPPPSPVRTNIRSLDGATAATLAWSAHAGQEMVETPFRVVEHAPAGATRESLHLQFTRENIAPNESGGAITSVGTLLRIAPPPAWLGMDGNPGHIICQCRLVGGLAAFSAVPLALRQALGATDSLAALLSD